MMDPPTIRWHDRLWLLASDMLVFDRRRLGWRLASRTTMALVLPLILAHLLDKPALSWIGIGAFLVAIGDSTDDGDRWQAFRLTVGALLGGLSLASGILAGADLFLAVLGMLFWGVLAGLMGVYGNAFATMGLPIAWAYVELGLPNHDHSLANATALGALFFLGGGFAMILTWAFGVADPYAPLRHQTAACFRAISLYIKTISLDADAHPLQVISPETRVRSTIAEARRIATQVRHNQHGSSLAGQRLVVLTEIADRLFALAAVLRETRADGREWSENSQVDSVPLIRLANAALLVAQSLSRRRNDAAPREAFAALDHQPPGGGTGDVSREMATEISHALRIVLGDIAWSPPVGQPEPTRVSVAAALAPLVACFDRSSLVARHALRFAVVAAIAVVIFWIFPPPFGGWIPLTVTVALKPYAGTTLARTAQRVVGTAAGILVGAALMPLVTVPTAQLAFAGFAFFWMMATIPFNYSLAVFFLSVGIIPFEHFMLPSLAQEAGLMRLAATGIGAILCVVGGHLLWPSFERNVVPALLGSTLRSVARYADCVLGVLLKATDLKTLDATHRQASLDTTNLQASVQRSVSELGGNPAVLQTIIIATTILQRLFISLNAVVNFTPDPAPMTPNFAAFRSALVMALNRLAADVERPPPDAPLDPRPNAIPSWRIAGPPGAQATAASAAFLDAEFDRMTAQIGLLGDAVGRLRSYISPHIDRGSPRAATICDA